MNLTLIAASLAGAVGFGSAWQLQAHTITKINLDAANDRISTQRAARTQAERRTTQVATAQNNATSRAVVLRGNVRSAGLIGDGLRVKTADTVRAAAADNDACPQSAATLGVVFDQCVGELQTLAERADRHVSDIQTITESWPK